MLEVNGRRANHATIDGELARRPPAGDGRVAEPLIAVVIPAYKQPGFLQDAVHSALRQTMSANLKIVIVNDGCPYRSTDDLGQLYASTHPGNVIYLRKENGGLSSARNYGIRFALDAWPSVRAIFPLDADNVLSPDTIEKLWRALHESPEDIGWAYHDLNIMGNFDRVWRTTASFSVYRLAHENLSDAGALIHRRIFESGVWYDESMKRGYEDWEFFLHAALEGFRAVHVPDTGFFYRRHGHSMLTDARQEHHDIYQTMLKKHADRLSPQQLIRLEHRELPRYALVELDRDLVRWTSNAHDADQSTLSIGAFLDVLAEWHAQPQPKTTYIPPLTLISHAQVIEFLRRLRVLPGLLFTMQDMAASSDCAYLNLERAGEPYALSVESASGPTQPVVFAIATRRLAEIGKQGRARLKRLVGAGGGFTRSGLSLSVGMSHVIHAGRPLENHRAGAGMAGSYASVMEAAGDFLGDLAKRLRNTQYAAARHQIYEERHRYAAANSAFAAQHQLDKRLGAFPYFASEATHTSPGSGIWFVTASSSATEALRQVVPNLARQLTRISPEVSLHLVVTDGGEVEVDPGALDPFATVTFLVEHAPDDEDAVSSAEELCRILAGADAVVIAESEAAVGALPELRAMTPQPLIVCLLEGTQPEQHGVPAGLPVLAARRYAQLIDHLVVPSRRLKRTCINLGATEDKVVVVPHAPTVSPSTLDEGLSLAERKTRRAHFPDFPLQILIAGRFDGQSDADPLSPIREQLSTRGVSFELQMLDDVETSSRASGEAARDAPAYPLSQEPAHRSQILTHSDIVVLPSRWGAAPSIALDAMSFGNVVVAVNVGGIDEIVEHGISGFLLDADLTEQELHARIGEMIAEIASGSLASIELRMEAVRSALSFSWHDAASQFAALLQPERGLR